MALFFDANMLFKYTFIRVDGHIFFIEKQGKVRKDERESKKEKKYANLIVP